MINQDIYDRALRAFWKSFNDYWSNAPTNWAPIPWLPAHDFPAAPEITDYPTTITQHCIHPECGAEYTYTRHSSYIISTKGFVDPFICRRPDPRKLNNV